MYSHYVHAISIVCRSIRSNNGSNRANCGRLLSVAVPELRRGGLAALGLRSGNVVATSIKRVHDSEWPEPFRSTIRQGNQDQRGCPIRLPQMNRSLRYRTRGYQLVLLLGWCAGSSLAQQKLTDRERMELAGPVKSLVTTTTQSEFVWHQPSGPSTLFPVMCRECEFDVEGNQTKDGQSLDGVFRGERIRISRDGKGNVTERFHYDATSGEIRRHEVLGEFGPTEDTLYQQGEVTLQTEIHYDGRGNMIDRVMVNGEGKRISRTAARIDAGGNNSEWWDYDSDDRVSLHVQHGYDPQAKVDRFTSFNEFGRVQLTWTVIDGKLNSFWEAEGSQPQYGDGFTHRVDANTFETYDCHGTSCEPSRVHYEYVDEKRKNPRSVEWRDANGNLTYGTYFEYEIDGFGNWTHRQVWVFLNSLGQRRPYQTDARSITYWEQ
jgi:hypothetical protein